MTLKIALRGYPHHSMRRSLRFLLCSLPATAMAADAPLSFNRDIRPILSENCFYCHGQDPNHREEDLRLDVREVALETKVIVPGKPEKSLLVERIFSADKDEVMPPPKSHRSLTPEQKE